MMNFQLIKNGLLALALWSVCLPAVLASSHREAPMISRMILADNVDLYAFRNPDNPNTITIIATYVPLQLPQGGPNYFSFGENIRYEIHIDNDASVSHIDEITYRFTFYKVNEDHIHFFQYPPRASKPENDLYTGKKYRWRYQFSDNCGKWCRSATQYRRSFYRLGSRFEYELCSLDEQCDYQCHFWRNGILRHFRRPVFVDLGGIFDLGDAPRQNGTPTDGLACMNVSTIALQIPISALLKEGAPATPANILDPNYVIGVWASASRQSIRTLSATGNPAYSGDWIQVSRLGMPLTNEAVIAIGGRDFLELHHTVR